MIVEIKKDLLQMGTSYPFAHCISSDWAMGVGIAKPLNKKFNIRKELYKSSDVYKEGEYPAVYVTRDSGRLIFNLVTKNKYYNKPTLTNMRKAIEFLKECMDIEGINMVAMPKIGCGLDRLRWCDVKNILLEVFDESKYEIIVCHL